MKELLFLFFICFILSPMQAQRKFLSVSNKYSKQEIVFPEYSRIRVKTTSNRKFSGKFRFLDEQTILVRTRPIKIDNIQKIKEHPILLTVVTALVFGYSGLVSGLTALFLYAFFLETSVSAALGLFSIACLYGVYFSPNPLKGYTLYQGWELKAVEF